MNKLNLGCGMEYKDGWVNADLEESVKKDVQCDIREVLPFKDNTFDIILMDDVIEHFTPLEVVRLLKELYRIGKKGCIIQIYTAHYSGRYAFNHLMHLSFYGTGTFEVLNSKEWCYDKGNVQGMFTTQKVELILFHPNSHMRGLDWIWNSFGNRIQQIWERLNPWGFAEIYYELKVEK